MANARARWLCATRCWRRSTSRRQAPIFPTRCGSTPTGRWCCRATPATARKSDRGQASYYYSQPFFNVTGRITIGDKPVEVTGLAWLDREWSSQPLAPDQTGWDWFSLHLNSGEKLMLYRLRQQDGRNDLFGNWIAPDGRSVEIASADNSITPTVVTEIAGRKVPTGWRVVIPAHGLAIETTALNAGSWMGTSFPYWEGPISFAGSHAGLGYLEMTGY